MRVKIFRGLSEERLSQEVNSWLAQAMSEIKVVKTEIQISSPRFFGWGRAEIIASVWYEITNPSKTGAISAV